jgi:hypothetical protein
MHGRKLRAKPAYLVTGVFFSDLLHCAVRESRGEPFVITNADILLGSIGDVVSRLTPGECLVCRRVDVDHPDQRTELSGLAVMTSLPLMPLTQ